MKLCKDCRHAKVGTSINCMHPNNVEPNLVTGGSSWRVTPQTLRKFTHYSGDDGKPYETCGPDGTWYEPIAVVEVTA